MEQGIDDALIGAAAGMAIHGTTAWMTQVRRAHGRKTKVRWFFLAYFAGLMIYGIWGGGWIHTMHVGSYADHSDALSWPLSIAIGGAFYLLVALVATLTTVWVIEMFDKITKRPYVALPGHWVDLEEVNFAKAEIRTNVAHRLPGVAFSLLMVADGWGGLLAQDLIFAQRTSNVWNLWCQIEQHLLAGGSYWMTE